MLSLSTPDVFPILIVGVLASCLTLMINYGLGKPSGEFSPYELFSWYTVWMSVRRLKVVGLYKEYEKQYNESLNRTSTKSEVISLKNDFKKMIYNAADPFFTWERAAGMCPVCTGFWVSLICALFFSNNLSEIIGITVISHITIRILNKIL